MYICIYVYMYICIYVYMYIDIDIHIDIDIDIIVTFYVLIYAHQACLQPRLFCVLLPLLHCSAPFASSRPVDPLGARGCARICQSCLQITPNCQQPGRVENKHPHRRRLGKAVEGQPFCEKDAPHYPDAASGHTPRTPGITFKVFQKP